MEILNEILTLKAVAEILDCTRKTAKRWCNNNGVELIKHIGSPRIYVSKSQFYYAFLIKFKKKHDGIIYQDNSKSDEEQINDKRQKRVKGISEINYIDYYKSRLLHKLNKI